MDGNKAYIFFMDSNFTVSLLKLSGEWVRGRDVRVPGNFSFFERKAADGDFQYIGIIHVNIQYDRLFHAVMDDFIDV